MKITTVKCKEYFCNLDVPVKRDVLPGNLLMLSVEKGIINFIDDDSENTPIIKLKALDISPNPDNIVILSTSEGGLNFEEILTTDDSKGIFKTLNIDNKVSIYLTCADKHTHKYFIEL